MTRPTVRIGGAIQGGGSGTPSGLYLYEDAKRADSALFFPAAYWRFNEGVGTNVEDHGKNGNDLTLNAPYAWIAGGAPDGGDSLEIQAGFLSGYLDTSRSKDFILTVAPSGVAINLGWTAFFRLKLNAVAGAGAPFVFRKSPSNSVFDTGSFFAAIYGTSGGANAGRFNFETYGGSPNWAGARVDDGGWHDLCVILDRTRVYEHLQIYQDGALVKTTASFLPPADQASARVHIANEGSDSVEISEIAVLPFAIPSTVPATLWGGGGGNQRRFNDLASGLIEV